MASLTDRSFWPKIWDATPPSPADISCATCHGYWRVKGTLLSRFIYLIRFYWIWVSYPTLTYHFQDAYFQFREACPLLRELGYRKFCQHEAWERMKGCNSSVVKYIHKVCTKKTNDENFYKKWCAQFQFAPTPPPLLWETTACSGNR